MRGCLPVDAAARGSGGMAEGALLPPPRQRGGGAAGPAARTVDRRRPAHARACGRAVASAADCRGEADGAVRGAAGTSGCRLHRDSSGLPRAWFTRRDATSFDQRNVMLDTAGSSPANGRRCRSSSKLPNKTIAVHSSAAITATSGGAAELPRFAIRTTRVGLRARRLRGMGHVLGDEVMAAALIDRLSTIGHRQHPGKQRPEETASAPGCGPPRTSRARETPDVRRRCSSAGPDTLRWMISSVALFENPTVER